VVLRWVRREMRETGLTWFSRAVLWRWGLFDIVFLLEIRFMRGILHEDR
jgi:hypothetical protein